MKYYDYNKSELYTIQHGADIKALCEKIRNQIQIDPAMLSLYTYSQKTTISRLLYDALRFFSCVIFRAKFIQIVFR